MRKEITLGLVILVVFSIGVSALDTALMIREPSNLRTKEVSSELASSENSKDVTSINPEISKKTAYRNRSTAKVVENSSANNEGNDIKVTDLEHDLRECARKGIIKSLEKQITVSDVDRCKESLMDASHSKDQPEEENIPDKENIENRSVPSTADLLSDLVPSEDKKRLRLKLVTMDKSFLERFKNSATRIRQLESLAEERKIEKVKPAIIVKVLNKRKTLDELYMEMSSEFES